MGFTTKIDYSSNRQLKQYQLTNTVLSGKTTFGVENIYLPIGDTGDTINIDALQNIRTKGLIFDDGSQQTNYVLTSDSRGRSRWKAPISTDNYGNINNNYELSRDLGFKFKEGELQEVIIAALNDSLLGGIHGFRYVEKYNSIFATDRNDPGTLYKFTDPSDLTQYVTLDLTVSGYTSPDNIIYSPEQDKLYCVMSDVTNYTKTIFKVWEIEPDSLQKTLIIDYDTSIPVGGPVFNVLGDYIFIANGFYDSKVHKFSLIDYSFTLESLPLGSLAGAHNIIVDTEKLYITSSWDYGGTYVSRVNATTLIIEEIYEFDIEGTDPAGGFTDDGVLVGDYLYLGSENHDNSGLWKFNKNSLSDNVRFDIVKGTISDAFWTVFYDGVDLWYAGSNNLFGKFNPNTLESYSFENPFTYNINELSSDGQSLYVAGFDTYPVTGTTGYVGRVSPPFKALKKRTFNLSGETLSDIDFSTNEMTYEVSSSEIDNFVSDKILVNREWVNAQNFGESHASGITFNPYITITGTTVQQAIEDVKNELDNIVISGGTGATSLNQLTDVTASATTLGDILISNGTIYTNRQLVESDISDFGNYITTQEDDYVTGATFNNTNGDVIMTRLSGGTVTVNLDGRYLTTATANTDDYVSGGTFNVGTGDLDLEMQSGGTVTINLDGRYLTTATANTDDYVSGGTFNSGTGDLDLAMQSGGTVTINLDGRYLTDYTNTDDYVSGATFNVGNGQLSLLRQSGTTIIVNLDGRYETGPTPPQTLEFSASTGDLIISGGNTANLDGRYPLLFENIVDSGVSYDTANQNVDTFKTVRMTGGTTFTLDKTGLTVGFQQQILNNTGADISLISSDTIIGNVYPLKDESVAYYQLISDTEWSVSIGGSAIIQASGVTFNSYKTLGSPDVQAAIQELKDEMDLLSISGGTGGVWGGILGLLSDQTDLQAELDAKVNLFEDTIVSIGSYDTNGQDIDTYKTVRMTGGTTFTLDKTGLTEGFQQQLLNDTGSIINLVSSDILIGNNIPLVNGAVAYYHLISATEWLIAIGGSAEVPASGVTFNSPYKTLDSTDVQAVVEELKDEVDLISASGGTGIWGLISGTLSAQTDLQGELDSKLSNIIEDTTPTLGGNLNVGSYNILSADGTSSYIDINNLGINWYFSNLAGFQDRVVFSNENTGISQSKIRQTYFNDAVFATTVAILESGENSVFENNFDHFTAPNLSNANIITSGPTSLITKGYFDTYGGAGGDVFSGVSNTFTENNTFEKSTKSGSWTLDRNYLGAGLNSDFYAQATSADGGAYLFSSSIHPLVFSNLLTPTIIENYSNSGAVFQAVATTNWANTYLERDLGDPSIDGYILSSTSGGTRSWIAPTTGGGDVYLASGQTFTGLNQFQNNQGIQILHSTGNNSGFGGVLWMGSGDGFGHSVIGSTTDWRVVVGSTSRNYILNKVGPTNTDDVITKGFADTNYVGVTGTPADGHIPVWTNSTTIEGTSALTMGTTTVNNTRAGSLTGFVGDRTDGSTIGIWAGNGPYVVWDEDDVLGFYSLSKAQITSGSLTGGATLSMVGSSGIVSVGTVGTRRFNVQTDAYIGTTLEVMGDPTNGDMVGNRDFNDGRYIKSTVTGEPTGTSVINNVVQISQADYNTAEGLGQLVATTWYWING